MKNFNICLFYHKGNRLVKACISFDNKKVSEFSLGFGLDYPDKIVRDDEDGFTISKDETNYKEKKRKITEVKFVNEKYKNLLSNFPDAQIDLQGVIKEISKNTQVKQRKSTNIGTKGYMIAVNSLIDNILKDVQKGAITPESVPDFIKDIESQVTNLRATLMKTNRPTSNLSILEYFKKYSQYLIDNVRQRELSSIRNDFVSLNLMLEFVVLELEYDIEVDKIENLIYAENICHKLCKWLASEPNKNQILEKKFLFNSNGKYYYKETNKIFNRKKYINASSLKTRVNNMSNIFEFGIINEIIEKNIINENEVDVSLRRLSFNVSNKKNKDEKGEKTPLTESQIMQMWELFENEKKSQIKRSIGLFLFQIETGMAYVDAVLIDKSNIQKIGDVEIFKCTRKKTKNIFKVPITDNCYKLMSFFEKDEDLIEQNQSNDTQRVVCEVNYSTYTYHLKQIESKFGIKLRSHIGRHTKNQTMAENGVSSEYRKTVLGQTTDSANQAYTHSISDEKIAKM